MAITLKRHISIPNRSRISRILIAFPLRGRGILHGPFTLLDLTGLDVTHPATELIYRQFYEEPRFRPNVMLRARMEAGMLGRKTGRGFYD